MGAKLKLSTKQNKEPTIKCSKIGTFMYAAAAVKFTGSWSVRVLSYIYL